MVKLGKGRVPYAGWRSDRQGKMTIETLSGLGALIDASSYGPDSSGENCRNGSRS